MTWRADSGVAQIFNLPYRRIGFGRVLDRCDALARSGAPQITNLRYGRVQLCATSRVAPSRLHHGGVSLYFEGMFPRDRNPRIERVRFELRSTGVKPEVANPLRSGVHTRGYLPHVKREGARYFVTFRLADSLPKEVLLKYQAERAERLQRFYAEHEASTHICRGAG